MRHAKLATADRRLCSPALSSSLGGLPPLFFLAGDEEALRDEIVVRTAAVVRAHLQYTAHKAAHPEKHPLRPELLDTFPHMREIQEKYKHCPTKVHLQVRARRLRLSRQIYDGQCHVFPMFAQTIAAKYAFRAIASFVKYVTGAPTDYFQDGTGRPMPSSREEATDTDFGPNAPSESKYSGKVPLMVRLSTRGA